MKVYTEASAFKPITIVIETEKELTVLNEAIYRIASGTVNNVAQLMYAQLVKAIHDKS